MTRQPKGQPTSLPGSTKTKLPATSITNMSVKECLKRYGREFAIGGLLLIVGGGMVHGLAEAPVPSEIEIAGYATSLRGRTAGQRHNASKAADAFDGKIIAPGAVFSFNATVKSWSADQGFVKAPVSYDGELIKAYGGGVCQTSTTLYNAALLAGLPIVERHAHVFAPHYVPPGLDAAVAQRNIDLRFRNPYKWPLRLRANVIGDHLEVRIFGAKPIPQHVEISTEILSVSVPAHLTRVSHSRTSNGNPSYTRNPGAVGCRVIAYRAISQRRERLSDDTYQAMDRIVKIDEK